jgi:hypothetical protein
MPPPLIRWMRFGSVVGAGPGSDTRDAPGSKHHNSGPCWIRHVPAIALWIRPEFRLSSTPNNLVAVSVKSPSKKKIEVRSEMAGQLDHLDSDRKMVIPSR